MVRRVCIALCWGAAASLTAGCGTPAGTGTTVADPAPTVPGPEQPTAPADAPALAPAATAAELDALCTSLDALQRAALEDERDALTEVAPEDVLPEAFAQCMRGRRGVWGLVQTDYAATFEAPEPPDEDTVVGEAELVDLEVEWTLVYLGADGLEARGEVPDAWTLDRGLCDSPVLDDVMVSDVDGDGRDELALDLGQRCEESDGNHWLGIFTVDEASPQPMVIDHPGTDELPIWRIDDFDQDGLVDVWTGDFAGQAINCADYDVTFGVELPAHATGDGRWVHDDEVARAELMALCPEAPAAFPTDVTPERFMLNVVCARLWGVEPATVTSALEPVCRPDTLRQRCAQTECVDTPADAGCLDSCVEVLACSDEICQIADAVRSWIDIPAPVRLDR